MVNEPRFEDDYTPRQVEAARRVIVDVMQVLAAYSDCIVLIGGWVPELLIGNAGEDHVGSVDVDLALDTEKLQEGRYAEMLKLLLGTRRYKQGELSFQLEIEVDLKDGGDPVLVDVEFLAKKGARTEKNRPKKLDGFRTLKADGCAAAFDQPVATRLEGRMTSGAENAVTLQIASIADFLVMKAYALAGRDKPKDAYDICYCLDNYDGGIEELAEAWKSRADKRDYLERAVEILREKFATAGAFGPMQVVAFHNESDEETREQQARRAYELVSRFLVLVTGA